MNIWRLMNLQQWSAWKFSHRDHSSIWGRVFMETVDVDRLLQVAKAHDFSDILRSIDYIHCEWKNYPSSWKAVFTKGIYSNTKKNQFWLNIWPKFGQILTKNSRCDWTFYELCIRQKIIGQNELFDWLVTIIDGMILTEYRSIKITSHENLDGLIIPSKMILM